MRITKYGITFVLLMVVLSIFIANFLNLISIENEDSFVAIPSTRPRMGNSPDHLMWFTQVSDLHLSFIQDEARGSELLELCDDTMKIINPSVILVTGDLTDAKKTDGVGSTQIESEWRQYRSILNKCETIKTIPWLDIRGNHDNFDVPSISSSRNMFRNYSMQGGRHSRSYVHKVISGTDSYAFVGLDACPAVGLKRPFNFVGVLPESEVAELRRLIKTVNDSDYTIWFGHYPTSCILSRRPGVRSVIGSDKRSLAYLCGHFHTMLGAVPDMYTLQKEGFYELELGDWKDNRVFRLVAIDHGLLSFVDVKFRDWPIILVTNPKNALFQSKKREPLGAMQSSTDIRVLVFSPSGISSVQVRLDGGDWVVATPSAGHGHLYTLGWDPNLYRQGLHNIAVRARDKEGRDKTISQTFSLDGSRLDFRVLPRILLMLNFSIVMQMLYGLSVASCILPYCYFRYMNKQAIESEEKLPTWKNNFVHRWIKRVWIVSNIDSLFYPIVLYPLYISVGPWAVAEVLDGQYGVIFIWGVVMNDGSVILLGLTYTYGFIQLFLFHGPLVTFTAYAVEKRLTDANCQDRERGHNKVASAARYCAGHAPYVVLLTSQLMLAYSFALAYGPWSVIAGPMRLWPIAQVFWVWYQARSMPLRKMKKASRAWDRVAILSSQPTRLPQS